MKKGFKILASAFLLLLFSVAVPAEAITIFKKFRVYQPFPEKLKVGRTEKFGNSKVPGKLAIEIFFSSLSGENVEEKFEIKRGDLYKILAKAFDDDLIASHLEHDGFKSEFRRNLELLTRFGQMRPLFFALNEEFKSAPKRTINIESVLAMASVAEKYLELGHTDLYHLVIKNLRNLFPWSSFDIKSFRNPLTTRKLAQLQANFMLALNENATERTGTVLADAFPNYEDRRHASNELQQKIRELTNKSNYKVFLESFSGPVKLLLPLAFFSGVYELTASIVFGVSPNVIHTIAGATEYINLTLSAGLFAFNFLMEKQRLKMKDQWMRNVIDLVQIRNTNETRQLMCQRIFQ